MSLITLAEASVFLGLSSPSAAVEAEVTAMIGAAQEMMEGQPGCNRHLEGTTVTEYLDGGGQRRVWLGEPPESITSVHVDGNRTFAASSLVDSGDYMTDGCVLDYLDHIWAIGKKNLKVVYVAGFTTIPDDVAYGCKVQVAAMYSAWLAAQEGRNILQAENVAGWSRRYLVRKGLEQEVKDMLKSYHPARL